ncbi:MAG: response regulator [Candidatus Scalindua sp.]
MNKKTLLLIEDNPDDVELARLALKREAVECELVVMRDGTEALDYILADGERANVLPDVILLDLKLPKISGLEVLKHLRSDERTKLIPVVILTSSDEERDVIESYKLGANSYIRKPVTLGKFSEVIRLLGEYWLQLNQHVLLR